MAKFSHDDPQYRAGLSEMSRRLNALMNSRNWSRADLTRAASKHMPEGSRFGPDNTSNFVNGKRRPTRPFLIAMTKAFGVTEEDILPPYLIDRPGDAAPPTPLLAVIPGTDLYRVFIDRELPLKQALRLVHALEEISNVGSAIPAASTSPSA